MRRKEKGFTLLEIIIVMAVIALGLALVAPSFTLPYRQPKPEIVAFLESEKLNAIKEGRAHAIYYENQQLWVETAEVTPYAAFTLPEDQAIKVEKPPQTRYLDRQHVTTFYPDGTAILTEFGAYFQRGGLLGKKFLTVQIHPIHGKISYDSN